MAGQQLYCKKCNRTMDEKQFYGSNNLEKYPNGKLDICKKCLTMHVDNLNQDTYLWILQEVDVPYVPDEWFKLLETYGKNPEKMTGMTIIGKYLSKMKLKQWKDFRWKDTEFIQEMQNAKIEQAMKQQNYGAAEIAAAIEKRRIDVPQELSVPDNVGVETRTANGYYDVSIPFNNEPDDDFVDDLTEDDKLYLKLKWGKAYRPDEWVRLEQLYEEMDASYDIQGAAHKDTLKLLCKTSLKANQLIDVGDVEGYQKMSKVYDTLLKSGKFSAAQIKESEGEFVSSIGELVAICEAEGFIPRYYVDEPKDKVDATIADLKEYTRSLVENEQNLGSLIEQSIKTMMREEAKEEDEDIEAELTTLDQVEELTEQDFEAHQNFLEAEALLDEELLKELG